MEGQYRVERIVTRDSGVFLVKVIYVDPGFIKRRRRYTPVYDGKLSLMEDINNSLFQELQLYWDGIKSLGEGETILLPP